MRGLLDEVGIAYEVDPALVRGLDYYTRTVFEFTSDALGAQSGVGGGGRYDGLVEQLGGPPTPGIGWAAGVERILLAAGERRATGDSPMLFVAVPKAGTTARRRSDLARDSRRERAPRELGEPGRSMKGQLKQADRVGARWTVIVEDDGFELKDMESGRAAAGRDRRTKCWRPSGSE